MNGVASQIYPEDHDTMRPLKKLRRAQPPPALHQCHAPPTILSDDLIYQILSWLPVKSLLRFRCVCKSWKSSISDPYFVKLHLHRSSSNADMVQLLLTLKDRVRRSVASYPVRSFLNNPSSTIAKDPRCRLNLNRIDRVIGSCNGLVCLADAFLEDEIERHQVRFCNLATRSISEKSPSLEIRMCNLQCDSLIGCGTPKYAFGYDHLSDTYKVVSVILDYLHNTLVKVYSMGDDCWRTIQGFPASPMWLNDGKFLSGTVNWVVVRSCYEDQSVTNDQLVIVSLDLGKETYRQLLLPHIADEIPHVEPNLGVLKDCLCVSHDYNRAHFVVWQMKEFGVQKSWTQLVKISYQDVRSHCSNFFRSFFPLCMSENGDVLMASFSARSRAILYYTRDSRVEHLEIPCRIDWTNPLLYVESLVLTR